MKKSCHTVWFVSWVPWEVVLGEGDQSSSSKQPNVADHVTLGWFGKPENFLFLCVLFLN